MTHSSRRSSRFVELLLLLTVGCSAVSEESPDAPETLIEAKGTLYVDQPGNLWTNRGNVVPVCWVAGGFDNEKQIMREVLGGTWERWANITFIGFEQCATTGTQRFVRVSVTAGTDAFGGGNAFIGLGAFRLPSEGNSVNIASPGPITLTFGRRTQRTAGP
jgi:hypothetical protein